MVSDAHIPSVLLEHLPKLSAAYAKYCSGIPMAQQLYEQKLTEKDFIDFEKGFHGVNKPTLNYIMRPVQVRNPSRTLVSLHCSSSPRHLPDAPIGLMDSA